MCSRHKSGLLEVSFDGISYKVTEKDSVLEEGLYFAQRTI